MPKSKKSYSTIPQHDNYDTEEVFNSELNKTIGDLGHSMAKFLSQGLFYHFLNNVSQNYEQQNLRKHWKEMETLFTSRNLAVTLTPDALQKQVNIFIDEIKDEFQTTQKEMNLRLNVVDKFQAIDNRCGSDDACHVKMYKALIDQRKILPEEIEFAEKYIFDKHRNEGSVWIDEAALASTESIGGGCNYQSTGFRIAGCQDFITTYTARNILPKNIVNLPALTKLEYVHPDADLPESLLNLPNLKTLDLYPVNRTEYQKNNQAIITKLKKNNVQIRLF